MTVLTDAADEKELCPGLERKYFMSIKMIITVEQKLLSAYKRLQPG